MKRDFKGIWIPAKVWLNKDLSTLEKVLLAEIDSLDGQGGCFASNSYFATFFDLSKSRVSALISGLKDKGFISVSLTYKTDSHEIDSRVIRVTTLYSESSTPILENKDTLYSEIGIPMPKNNNDITKDITKDIAKDISISAKAENQPIRGKNPFPSRQVAESWEATMAEQHASVGLEFTHDWNVAKEKTFAELKRLYEAVSKAVKARNPDSDDQDYLKGFEVFLRYAFSYFLKIAKAKKDTIAISIGAVERNFNQIMKYARESTIKIQDKQISESEANRVSQLFYS